MPLTAFLNLRSALHGSVAALLTGASFLPAPVWSASPPPAAKAHDEPDDWRLSLQARKALQKDQRFAALNIGVTVREGGVATLWGPVPSAEVGRQAEEALRKVRGVTKILNDTRVVAPSDPLIAQVTDALREKGVQTEPPAPGTATVTTAKVTSAKPAANAGKPGDPDEATAGMATLAPPPAAVLLQPVNSDAPPAADNFGPRWQRLQEREPRFREVQLERQNGVVRIGGTVGRSADAWELAELLSEFEGVTQVIVGAVRTK